jgi:hypothetical protein
MRASASFDSAAAGGVAHLCEPNRIRAHHAQTSGSCICRSALCEISKMYLLQIKISKIYLFFYLEAPNHINERRGGLHIAFNLPHLITKKSV